ncbi:unnamed protein product [Litomosoides sigmodontis]|uniref:Abscisic acid G-protein coupled receptor-like domain-containing protein n=1 Tax=Litomosoides sigmodontis TaxID=42156 RepID=A0A3P6TA43_LITSI|nr:unnamed protein product [Litomosoides sigmodontis]
MWKIFICTVNIVFDRVGKVDPVTRGIEIAVNYIGFQLDIRFWSQHISFLLVGVIAVTSIRGLKAPFAKRLEVKMKFFSFCIARTRAKLPFIRCVEAVNSFGMYFVSTVLLMRMNMPHQYRFVII